MTWEELATLLEDDLFDAGGHSLTHPQLAVQSERVSCQKLTPQERKAMISLLACRLLRQKSSDTRKATGRIWGRSVGRMSR